MLEIDKDEDEDNPNHKNETEEEEEDDLEAQQRTKRRNQLKFWLTAIFLAVGSLCFSAFLFLIPFQIDPAISAILADFHPEETLCSVVSAELFVGISSCAWSSCSEGCTRDLYKCFQIKVNYTAAPGAVPVRVQPEEEATNSSSLFTGFLYVNVRGCGYPPDVSCESFFQRYGRSREPFPCFYSKRNSSVVITSFRKEDEIRTIIVSCIPILGILISSIGIAIVPRKQKKSASAINASQANKSSSSVRGTGPSTPLQRRGEGEEEDGYRGGSSGSHIAASSVYSLPRR